MEASRERLSWKLAPYTLELKVCTTTPAEERSLKVCFSLGALGNAGQQELRPLVSSSGPDSSQKGFVCALIFAWTV